MSKTIAIVEDDEIARVGLAAILEGHGYQTASLCNAEEAMDWLHREPTPDLILLDMVIPGADGWQFVARRAKEPRLAPIPIVIMTGLGVAGEGWARSLGAVALLRKPIAIEELLALVAKFAGAPSEPEAVTS